MARTEPGDEPEVHEMQFSRALEAVADPIRLSIIVQLAASDRPMSCSAIELPVKASTATHHFAALRRAGLIHQYWVGTSRMNVLRTADVEAAFPGFLPAVIRGATGEGPEASADSAV